MPAGFPPFVEYSLQVHEAPAARQPGVGFTRDEVVGRMPIPCLPVVAPNDCYRSWLVAMGAGAATAAFVAQPSELRVLWRGRDDLRRRVRPATRVFDAPFRSLVRELQGSRALTAAEARAARPTVAIVVCDCRGNRSLSLPTPQQLLAPPR